MTVIFSEGRGLTFGGIRNVDVFVGTLLAGKTLSVQQAFTAVAEGNNLMTVSLLGDKVYGDWRPRLFGLSARFRS